MNSIIAVIVTYNRKELLKENMEALINQSYKEFDILVVDNASTDGTFEYIKRLVNDNDFISYFNTGKNLGGAGGFSLGIKEACLKGYEKIWIMDDDTSNTTLALIIIETKDALLILTIPFSI